MKVALMFSGQGSHHQNMIKELTETDIKKIILNKAEKHLGYSLESIDSKESLSYNKNIQISLFLYHAIYVGLFKELPLDFDMVCGHSIGIFGAAFISEIMSFERMLATVNLRGKLMEEAYPTGYGMAVIIGLEISQILIIIQQINQNTWVDLDKVYLANINSDKQITVSGRLDKLELVIKLAKQHGAQKSKLLNVAVPSHCALMDSVSNILKNYLIVQEDEQKQFHQDIYQDKNSDHILSKKAKYPYISNTTARLLWNSDKIIEDLYKGVSSPVQWYDMVTMMYERGVRLFIEVSPKPVLSEICKSLFPDTRTIATNNTSLEERQWIVKKLRS